ncbi:unnamed protein product [Brachionus calyciflorus]|uniref:Uncharacterized protein n=1 Tax=Brachionus calyciflorus TaxID=104777 RepID=A0A814EZ94_9BILA|nr:unnamed protein product [Brachionus calyciflorus]
MINIFPDFKIVPDELRGLKNYFQINNLSLCTLCCNTFQPTNYAYWQFYGKKNIVNKTEHHLKGTFGLILDNVDKQIDDDRNVVRNAYIGLCYKKDTSNKIIPTKIYNCDSDLEPKLFPHLCPYGTGYYIRNSSSVTTAQYFLNRLLNVDPRWREDKFYLFYAYDRLTRERIFAVNSMIKARNSLIETKNIEKLVKNDFEEYFEYGNCVPRSITGSKSYWSSKYYDLISIINNKDHNILDDLYLDDEEVLIESEFVQLRDEPFSDTYEIKNL